MPEKILVRTDKAPAPFAGAPYSQAVRFGDLVFVSGQIPIDPATGTVIRGGIADQTERVMANLRAILEQAGSSLEKLLKTTVFLKNRDDWAAMNEVYARHVGARPPARAAIEVGRLAFDVLIEIEAIAHV